MIQQPIAMATSGGPHPPELWARVTAMQLASGEAADKVAGIMVKFHARVQERERKELSRKGSSRLSEPFDLDAIIEEAAQEIVKLAPEHYTPEVRSILAATLRQHFEINAEIERSWHADRVTDGWARAYKAARANHGAHRAWAHAGEYRSKT